jgi:hypothetical protein
VDEKEVKSEEIVKGYEYQKGKWVTLTDEDFAKVEIESTHTIEITDFRGPRGDQSKVLLQAVLPRSAEKGARKATRCSTARSRKRARRELPRLPSTTGSTSPA